MVTISKTYEGERAAFYDRCRGLGAWDADFEYENVHFDHMVRIQPLGNPQKNRCVRCRDERGARPEQPWRGHRLPTV